MNAKMGEQQKEKYETDLCISGNAPFTHARLTFNHSEVWEVVPFTGKCCMKINRSPLIQRNCAALQAGFER